MKTPVAQFITLVGVASAAAFLVAAELHPGESVGLTVHEWGTFTSVAGADGAAIDWDALGGKDDLPSFVNDFGYRCFKWRLTGTVRMETPVIYFYSRRAVNAHVKVAFPQGLITEWYPRADYEVTQMGPADSDVRTIPSNLNGIDTSLRTLTGGIEWKEVKVEPNATPALPAENAPSRYYAARATDAAPVTAGGQHEKFLFYRGVGRFAVPLSARSSGDGKVLVENRKGNPVPVVILFENRSGHLGFRNVGTVKDAVTIAAPSLDGNFSRLRSDLESALVSQGLFPREAKAMIETWKDSWFEEGSRVIYIVPARTIDAALPLQVEPVPSALARVFVGRIELITSETMRTVQAAMAKRDWPTIERYGRFMDPILARIVAENPTLKGQLARFRAEEWGPKTSAQCR